MSLYVTEPVPDASLPSNARRDQALSILFDRYDTDKDGAIDAAEMCAMLSELLRLWGRSAEIHGAGDNVVARSHAFASEDARHLIHVMSMSRGDEVSGSSEARAQEIGRVTSPEFARWILRADSAMKTVTRERIRASNDREARMDLYARLVQIAARHIERPNALHKPQRTRSRTTRAGSSVAVKLAAGAFFDRYNAKSLGCLAIPQLSQMIADVYRASGKVDVMQDAAAVLEDARGLVASMNAVGICEVVGEAVASDSVSRGKFSEWVYQGATRPLKSREAFGALSEKNFRQELFLRGIEKSIIVDVKTRAKVEKQQTAAATKIQCQVRGAQARTQAEEVKRVSVEETENAEREQQVAAATKIQSRVRGAQTRAQAQDIKQASVEETENAKRGQQVAAATKNQSQERGAQTRVQAQEIKRVSIEETENAEREQQVAAATKIQSRVRGAQTRVQVQGEKRRSVHKSSTALQSENTQDGNKSDATRIESSDFCSIQFVDGPLGFTFRNNELTVMDVEPGSQADFLDQNLIGSTVTQVNNERETRQVSTIVEFGQAVSGLSRPVTIQFRRPRSLSKKMFDFERDVEELLLPLLETCPQNEIKPKAVKVARQCAREVISYGECCVIISHVLRGTKKNFLKMSASRAHSSARRAKLENLPEQALIGDAERIAAKASIDMDAALTPSHRDAVNEVFQWVQTFEQLFEVLISALRCDPARIFRRFSLMWRPQCEVRNARRKAEISGCKKTDAFDGTLKRELMACVSSYPHTSEHFRDHARYCLSICPSVPRAFECILAFMDWHFPEDERDADMEKCVDFKSLAKVSPDASQDQVEQVIDIIQEAPSVHNKMYALTCARNTTSKAELLELLKIVLVSTNTIGGEQFQHKWNVMTSYGGVAEYDGEAGFSPKNSSAKKPTSNFGGVAEYDGEAGFSPKNSSAKKPTSNFGQDSSQKKGVENVLESKTETNNASRVQSANPIDALGERAWAELSWSQRLSLLEIR